VVSHARHVSRRKLSFLLAAAHPSPRISAARKVLSGKWPARESSSSGSLCRRVLSGRERDRRVNSAQGSSAGKADELAGDSTNPGLRIFAERRKEKRRDPGFNYRPRGTAGEIPREITFLRCRGSPTPEAPGRYVVPAFRIARNRPCTFRAAECKIYGF